MATATRPRTSPGIVLEDVTWAEYEAHLQIIGERHIRVNYDSGRMELISPTRRREPAVVSCLLGSMVHILVEEIDIQLLASGLAETFEAGKTQPWILTQSDSYQLRDWLRLLPFGRAYRVTCRALLKLAIGRSGAPVDDRKPRIACGAPKPHARGSNAST